MTHRHSRTEIKAIDRPSCLSYVVVVGSASGLSHGLSLPHSTRASATRAAPSRLPTGEHELGNGDFFGSLGLGKLGAWPLAAH
jgi:hypothetical protein